MKKYKRNETSRKLGAYVYFAILGLLITSGMFYLGYEYGKANCINTIQTIDDPEPEPIAKEVMEKHQAKLLSASQAQVVKLEEKIVCPEEDEEDIKEIVIDVNDVTILSNASVEMMEQALSGTKLESYAQLYYDLEQEYEVNAFIAMGNAIQESGWKHKEGSFSDKYNNIYGLMGKEFDTIEDCIRYYFRLIHKNYVGKGLTSLEDINKKYCPPDDSWDDDIYQIAKKLKNKIDITPK